MEKKLPVLATIVAAFELCRTHLSYALKIIAPWFVILLIAPYLLAGLFGENPTVVRSDSLRSWEWIVAFFYFAGWGSIAVLWHWRILRNDRQNQEMITFDRRVWSYLLRGLLIALIVGGVALLLMVPFGIALTSFVGDFTESFAFFGAAACLIIVTSYIAARLSVALPAIALGAHEFGLSRAWNATTDNGFRLLIVTALPFLPVYLFSWGLALIGVGETGLDASSALAIVLQVFFQLLDFAFGLLGLTVLSLTYAFFAENKEARGVLGFS